MDDALKARFRAFADSWNDDDQVDDGGLTGADIKAIADKLDSMVQIDRMTLGQKS